MKVSHRRTLVYLAEHGRVNLLPGHGTGLRWITCDRLRQIGLVRIEGSLVALTDLGRHEAARLVRELNERAARKSVSRAQSEGPR